jgi:hypothetical protein
LRAATQIADRLKKLGISEGAPRFAENYNDYIDALYQNDDFGKDNFKGLKDGLGDKASTMIVAEKSYEVTDPTVDSQIVALKGSGADTFADFTGPKFGVGDAV